MRLLITTQAVDLDDPVLGFFHAWIEQLAKRCERVDVICLKEGRHDLPENVRVRSLGKETGRSRLQYVLRFLHLIYFLRGEYDSVFVHMNSEYVCLGGLFWRQWGKRIVLWRNHKIAGFSTWLAAHLADSVLYTSSSSYVARFKNSVQMPLGIDTDMFAPGAVPIDASSVLFFGRLDEVKKPHVFVDALQQLHERGISFRAEIVGDPTYADSLYAHDVRNRAGMLALDGTLVMRPGVPHREAPDLFRAHAIYVNLTPSGSFDKTIGEAAAAGCIVVAANEALHGVVPDSLIVDPSSSESVARGIQLALGMAAVERESLSHKVREYVMREHSLSLLLERLLGILNA